MKKANASQSSFSRRKFLNTSLMAAAGVALAGAGCNSSKANKTVSSKKMVAKAGLQLYSIPHLLEQDFRGTLKTVAGIGYKELEFAGPYSYKDWKNAAPGAGKPTGGYYGNTPAEVKQMLNEYGLTAPSAHIPKAELQNNLAPFIEAAHTVGHEYLVVPFLDAPDRGTIDIYKRLADEFNKIGAACKAGGIQLAYHNHSFEFGTVDGQVLYDILLNNTDKDLVKFELDLFWISMAGFDPVAYFKKYPGRFRLVHCKNMATSKTLPSPLHSFDNLDSIKSAFANQTNLGTGIIDFKRIIAAAKESGVEHFIVERDRLLNSGEQELATIKDGYNYISNI